MLYHRDVLGVIGQSGLHAEERDRPAEGSSRPPQRTSLLFYIADEKVWVCRVYMFQ